MFGSAKLLSRSRLPVQFIGYSQSALNADATSLSINKPAAVLEDDLLVAVLSQNSPNGWSGDTGWTEEYDQLAQNGMRIAWKKATASEPASYTFTIGVSRRPAGQILQFRNADFDQVGSIVTGNGDTTLVVPGVASSEGMIGVVAATSQIGTRTFTTPPGMSATATTLNDNGSSRTYLTAFYEPSFGAPGTRSVALGSSGASSQGNNAIMFSVRERA